MTIDAKLKSLFFDREKVRRAVSDGFARALSKAGAFVRRRARSSLVERKKASRPGTPPSVHSKDAVKTLKNIWFVYQPNEGSVVIGPLGLGSSDAPHAEEFGGTYTRSKPIPRAAGRKATPAQAAAFRKLVKSRGVSTRKVPRVSYQAYYPPRPYMGPALRAEIEAGTIASAWTGVVRGAGSEAA